MFGQRQKKALKAYWALYDEYIETQNPLLRPEISKLLGMLESRDRDTQLLRPEIGWNTIVAWQVLRNQKFIFDTKIYHLYEGEILAVSGMCIMFLTRISPRFKMPGGILKPGYQLDYKDRGEISAHKWDHMVAVNGITDEVGLYMPIHDPKVAKKLAFSQTDTIKNNVVSFLKKEKGYVSEE